MRVQTMRIYVARAKVGRWAEHDAVADAINCVVRRAAVTAAVEVPGLERFVVFQILNVRVVLFKVLPVGKVNLVLVLCFQDGEGPNGEEAQDLVYEKPAHRDVSSGKM